MNRTDFAMTRRGFSNRSAMSKSVGWALCLCLSLLPFASRPEMLHAQEILLRDDFADASDWQRRESRHNQEIVTEGIRVEITSHRDGDRTEPFLRVEDRSSRDHWFWLHKRKAHGVWDLSRAATVTLRARSDGARSVIRFLVGDSRGNIAYYGLGEINSREWTRTSLDLKRTPPFNTAGVVDWCAVAYIGLRTDPGHGYMFDFRDLRIEAEEDGIPAGAEADRLCPESLTQAPTGFLAPVSSGNLSDSMVGINLTGNEEEADLDRLARAGVKWAKLSCFLQSGYFGRTQHMVDALLARRIQVVGQLPQTLSWSKELFPDAQAAPGERVPIAYSSKATAWFQERVRETAERLRGRVRVWEIGNEPDIAKFWMPTPDPAAFAGFVIETSKVLKAVDSRNLVISGGVCGFWGSEFSVARDFLTTFFEVGAGEHIDILGLHPYRPHPESGAVNMHQRQVADEIRSLMARFDRNLPLWDTEWQITGAVDRSEVPFATDLYEAKGMLRKYLVEADAGFVHLNWQIAKARPNMDHPGQIFTADGRAAAKYATLCNTGALFARLAGPVDVPTRLADRAEEAAPALLARYVFDEPSSLQAWDADPGVAMDAGAAFRGNGAAKLSGGPAARMETVSRWRPVHNAMLIEVRGVIKGDGCDVVVHLSPRDSLGNDLPLPLRSKPLVAESDYTPFCFRFQVEPDWHDFGLRVELPKGGTAFVDELTLLQFIPPPEIVSFAFEVRGSPAPAVFFWTPAKPSDRQQCRTVELAMQGIPDGDFALVDTLTGAIRRLKEPRRMAGELRFHDLPLCDYPMAITSPDAFPTAPVPVWLAVFADADDVVNRSFLDRTGDFYLRGLWNVAFDLADLAGVSDERLAALRRVRSFWRAFPGISDEIAIRPSASARTTLRPAPDAWRDSVANSSSRYVNRFYHKLDDADRPAAVHGVTMGDRGLPQRPWADSPDNAYTWFLLCRREQPSEVFVVVPKQQAFDGRDMAIDLSLSPRAKAVLLSSRNGEDRCIGYWTEAAPGQEAISYSVELEDRGGWSSGVVRLDPRTGEILGRAAVKQREGGRIVLETTPAPQPLLLVPEPSIQSVIDSLSSAP